MTDHDGVTRAEGQTLIVVSDCLVTGNCCIALCVLHGSDLQVDLSPKLRDFTDAHQLLLLIKMAQRT
jgi:hypothetical protein